MDQQNERKGPGRRGRPRGRPPVRTDDGRFWDAADVANLLKVSEAWVYSKVEQGVLPHVRLPGSISIRFNPAAIRAYLAGEWPAPLKTA